MIRIKNSPSKSESVKISLIESVILTDSNLESGLVRPELGLIKFDNLLRIHSD